MSKREAKRVYVMDLLMQGRVTVKQAAQALGLSEHQVKRLKAGMKQEGLAALVHGNRGRKPKHAVPKEVKTRIVELATERYHGASHQHMAELFKQYEGISLSPKTISGILAQAGISNRHSHKAARRRRSRDRMPQAGMLVQMDASPLPGWKIVVPTCLCTGLSTMPPIWF
ncbi:MAG: helix-turn-helix domain-containing protein [bacterium]